MPRGELLKRLFHSYAQGDGEAFHLVAGEIIRDEESKNNRVLASALRRNLGSIKRPIGNKETSTERDGARRLAVVPFEREKNLPLVDIIQPERRASDLILDRNNQRLLLSLLSEFRQRETLGAHGLRSRSRLLFCGPPGCGKTLCAEVFANEVKLPLLSASMDALVSSLLGETASNLRKIFDYAAVNPVVLLLDEFDAIARLRDDETLNGELRRVGFLALAAVLGFFSCARLLRKASIMLTTLGFTGSCSGFGRGFPFRLASTSFLTATS
jgi:SpoVK/Ycf46/Vps4 family AAA+-type ATPase